MGNKLSAGLSTHRRELSAGCTQVFSVVLTGRRISQRSFSVDESWAWISLEASRRVERTPEKKSFKKPEASEDYAKDLRPT